MGINVTYGTGSSGGGVSFCDFDGDGWDDLTLASQLGDSLHFYKNNGGVFTKIPALVDNTQETKQVLWVDFDNDGDKDLFVTAKGGVNHLYENLGNLELMEITETAGLLQDTIDCYGACWGDYNRDGWLDLFVTKRNLSAATNYNFLYFNNGDGTFTEVGDATNVDDPGKAPFCAAFLDYNNDKWPDLYLAQDKTKINTLLRNNGDETYTNTSVLSGANLAMNAMSVAVGDYNRDGWQDIYISNTPHGNRLLKNDGDETFTEVSIPTGTTFNGTAWGALFLDVDNDGWEDIYVSGMDAGASAISSALYLNNTEDAFWQPTLAMPGDTASSFGNAMGDFNADGVVDLAVINIAPFHCHIWENQSSQGLWLKLKLEGVRSNRDGIGTKVLVYTDDIRQLRYKHCGIGYLGQNMDALHFGLGTYAIIDSIVIEWPTGHLDRLLDITANQVISIQEGSTTNGIINVDPELEPNKTIEFSPVTNKVQVYPNPSLGDLNVETSSFPATYSIFDPSGQQLQSGMIWQQNSKINCHYLPSGCYWLQIKWQDEVFWQKLIIQK